MHCARISQKLLMNGKESFYLLFVVFVPRMDKINKFRLKIPDITRSIRQQWHYRADSKRLEAVEKRNDTSNSRSIKKLQSTSSAT